MGIRGAKAVLAIACVAACGDSAPTLSLDDEGDRCYSVVQASWDETSIELESERLPQLPHRIRITSLAHPLVEVDPPLVGDFSAYVRDTRLAYFEFDDEVSEGSWIMPTGDSVLIGRQGALGGFWFGGRSQADSLIGGFRWTTDTGLHAEGFAPAKAVRVRCEEALQGET